MLRELAGRVRGLLRQSDYVARHGETLLVLLPNTSLGQAAIVATKIRVGAEVEPIPVAGGTLTVTVSVGVASLEPCDDAQALFARADRALGRAKDGGRNRVEVEQT